MLIKLIMDEYELTFFKFILEFIILVIVFKFEN